MSAPLKNRRSGVKQSVDDFNKLNEYAVTKHSHLLMLDLVQSDVDEMYARWCAVEQPQHEECADHKHKNTSCTNPRCEWCTVVKRVPIWLINMMWETMGKCYFISRTFSSLELHDQAKYLCSRRHLFDHGVDEAPYINVTDSMYQNSTEHGIQFINGRNRFANLRDMGQTHIPCKMTKSDYVFFCQLCPS